MPRWESSRADRFLAQVGAGASNGDCRVWFGYRDQSGYGKFGPVWAHRFAYELVHGVGSAAGLEVDHLCRRRECVNPTHLQAVTKLENLKRQAKATLPRTVCKYGHRLEGDNLYHYVYGSKRLRQCRTCAIGRSRARHAVIGLDRMEFERAFLSHRQAAGNTATAVGNTGR